MVTGIAAVGAAFAAIGSAVGVGVGLGTTFAGVMAGIAVSAVVGAAVGGLSAAIAGGDIGKGMLFGAVGGVVSVAGGAFIGGVMKGTTVASTATPAGSTIGGAGPFQAGAGSQSALAKGAGQTMFGGVISKEFAKAAVPAMFDFVKSGLAPDPEKPQIDYSKTKEGYLAGLKSAEKRQESASTGHAPPVWANTKEGVEYQREQDFKTTVEQGEQKMDQIGKEYSVANTNAADAFGRERDVSTQSADNISSAEYQGASADTKAAIVAQQGGALQGPSTEEVV